MAKKNGIYGFKAVRRGEQAVANSGGVQSVLAREAGYMAGNANAALGEPKYESRQVQGRFAKGYVVSVALLSAHSGRTEKWCKEQNDKRRKILEDQL